MKRTLFMLTLATILTSCSIGNYPVNQSVHSAGYVNISIQPSWGPAGYDYAMFYYFPDFNFYYDVERALFYYPNYGRWVSARYLPSGRGFPTDLHRYYKVVINQRNPWEYNRQHRNRYKIYKGVYTQRPLRDVRGREDYPYSYNYSPRRIPTESRPTPPARNNNVRPTAPYNGQGSRPSSVQPQGGTQSRPSVGQGSRRNDNSASQRPSSSGGQQRSSNSGGSKVNSSNRGSAAAATSSSRGTTQNQSQAGGSRSTGSRGR